MGLQLCLSVQMQLGVPGIVPVVHGGVPRRDRRCGDARDWR